MTQQVFIKELEKAVLVADGAMGSLLLERLGQAARCVDRLNLERPELVREVHADYLAAGARLIETNTFGANPFKLGALDLEKDLEAINRAGVELALDEARKASLDGERIWVGGSMGPPGKQEDRPDPEQVALAYLRQALVLVETGVDLLILETFADLDQLLAILRAVKGEAKLQQVPVMAQMVVAATGRSFDGHHPGQALRLMKQAGADVAGINCGAGPKGAAAVLAEVGGGHGPLSVFPNAGLPERMDDRLVYSSSPEYFARATAELAALGARVLGGCCGTGPEHIAALARQLQSGVEARGGHSAKPFRSTTPGMKKPGTRERISGQDGFAQKLGQESMVLVEIDPPKHLDIDEVLAGTKELEQAGVDAVTVAENPLGSPRFSNIALSVLLRQQSDLPIILHVTGRDRNSVGMQSTLMGLAGLGLTNVLALTGDPPPRGAEERVTGVFDLKSFELIELLQRFQQGTNRQGQDLRKTVSFRIGAAFNPNTRNVDLQLGRMERKIGLGAEYFLTQPVYSREGVDVVAGAEKRFNVPVFVGIMPLASHRNAEFLHNEFPGIRIPDTVRERMRQAQEKGAGQARQEGMDLAWELMQYAWGKLSGIYLIPPFARLEVAAELVRRLAGLRR